MRRIFFLPFQFFIINVLCDLPTIRQTTNGPVEGIEETSSLGQKYYAFRGIPFAEPPITGRDPYTGQQVDRRFKAPESLKRKWSETLKVHNFADSCMPAEVPNPNSLNQTSSENCLYLNVYVPASTVEKRNFTVLVFIPGGGFSGHDLSGPSLEPDFLLSEDNIVVILAYRVGIFGFLNLDYGEYTGNMALKDQQMALKWVYENIANFGGKNDEILLFGQSKGGACVHLQMLNEQSRKYFTRAFSMSGTAFYCKPLTLIEENHVKAMQNCTQIKEMAKLAKHLATADIGSLLEYNLHCQVAWAPTIESVNAPNAFLIKSPEEIYKSDKAPAMDAMFSFNSAEAIQSKTDLLNQTNALIEADWIQTSDELPFFIDGFTKAAYPKEYAQAMKLLSEAYFSNNEDIPHQNVAFVSDLGLVMGILEAVMYQANANNDNLSANGSSKNTFLFRFSVHTNLNSFQVSSNLTYDASTHGDDTCFIFQCPSIGSKMYIDDFKDSALNYQIIKRSVKMITNFARTGDPSIADRTPFKSCKSSKEILCTDITNDPISNIMTDIEQQSHYNTWHEVMEIYKNRNKSNSYETIPKSGSKSHTIFDRSWSKIGLILSNLLISISLSTYL